MADRPTNGGDATNRVAFDYIKSAHFRVIRADGAIGAITPNGHIHFSLYSERQAIPRRVVHEAPEGGGLGPLIEGETVSRGSVVREMDVDVFVNLETAVSLRDWLTDRIDELAKRLKVEVPRRENK